MLIMLSKGGTEDKIRSCLEMKQLENSKTLSRKELAELTRSILKFWLPYG